jgi:hypothetical protein
MRHKKNNQWLYHNRTLIPSSGGGIIIPVFGRDKTIIIVWNASQIPLAASAAAITGKRNFS